MLRQTRKSLAQSLMLTFERDVLPVGYIKGGLSSREHRSSYVYLNGSEIVCGGLDDPYKWESGEYDMVYIGQVEQCREEAIEIIKKRLSNFTARPDGSEPWVQLLMDANPRANSHWLKKRIDRKQTLLVPARWRDNPKYNIGTGELPPPGLSVYWNGQNWTSAGIEFLNDAGWTREGIAYLRSNWGGGGHVYERLMLGKWASPEGARFDGASRYVQGFNFRRVFPHGIPDSWKKWLSGDYGKADPYCCLWHTVSPQGVIYTYREDYSRGLEAYQQAQRIIELSPAAEIYEAIYLDQSMWSKEKSFGGDEVKGPAAEQYSKEFEAANAEAKMMRFGPPVKGARNSMEEGYVTLNSMLMQTGQWMISEDCLNLWDEIEDAVHFQDPTTGIWNELINPRSNKKDCQDHALEAAVYGIHKRVPITPKPQNTQVDYTEVYAARRRELVKHIERTRHRPKPGGFGRG